jgi:hypothetical protein
VLCAPSQAGWDNGLLDGGDLPVAERDGDVASPTIKSAEQRVAVDALTLHPLSGCLGIIRPPSSVIRRPEPVNRDPVQARMRILSWNIRRGGGSRLERIQGVIAGHNPDVLVLPEFRNNPAGDALRDWLAKFGHHHIIAPPTEAPAHNTVLLSAREPFVPVHFPELGAKTRRCIAGRFGRLTILACYFATMEAKRPLFEFIRRLPKKFLTAGTCSLAISTPAADIGMKAAWTSPSSRNSARCSAAAGSTSGASVTPASGSGRGSSPGVATSAIASIMPWCPLDSCRVSPTCGTVTRSAARVCRITQDRSLS